MPRQPKCFCALSTRIATVEAHRTPFPEEWRCTARENGRSVLADLLSTMGSYPRPKDLARSPPRSWARMGREAAGTCAPSRARRPGPSRRRRCVRSTAPLTPSHSTRRAPSSRSSSTRFTHRSFVRVPEVAALFLSPSWWEHFGPDLAARPPPEGATSTVPKVCRWNVSSRAIRRRCPDGRSRRDRRR
jgi:hypothetical protein